MDDEHDLTQTRAGALAGALFLFGLALIIWLDIFLPGIFAVIWITALPPLLVDKGWRLTLWVQTQMAIWFGGIGYMLDRGSLWPGILVVMGLSVLLVAIAPPDHLEALHEEDQQRGSRKAKRKRRAAARLGIPVPDDDEVTDADDPAHEPTDWLHTLRAAEEQVDEEQQGAHNG